MTSSTNLAHDQPIPFDDAADQKNDPFSFSSTPSTHHTASQLSKNEGNAAQDVSTLFGQSDGSSFFSQPQQDYSQSSYPQNAQATLPMQQSHSSTNYQIPQQSSTPSQPQQQYQPLEPSVPYDHHEQQYTPGETTQDTFQQQQQSYQPEQWQQFDPNVHYYYDEQGQYHYYDPNTGQDYDYTQYAYQNGYDPHQYYSEHQQQQYTTTDSGQNLATDQYTPLDGRDTTYTPEAIPQQQTYQSFENTTTNISLPLNAEQQAQNQLTGGLNIPTQSHPGESEQSVGSLAAQKEGDNTANTGSLEQVNEGNMYGNGMVANGGLPGLNNKTVLPLSTSTPQTTTPSQKWDQLDVDSRTDVLAASQTGDQQSTLHTEAIDGVDKLGDDLDDLILGGPGQSERTTATAPPTLSRNIYHPVSRTTTPQLPSEPTITCFNPSCQTVNKPLSKFCEDCGTPFATNGSRAPTPAMPAFPQTATVPTPTSVYDPSIYNRTYSPSVPENQYSSTATPLYEPQQQQTGVLQQNTATQQTQPQIYGTTQAATPVYSNEPQPYISRTVTPVYNPLSSSTTSAPDASIYSAPQTQPVYPSTTLSTSVYEPSSYYGTNNNTTPVLAPMANQQSYSSDIYSTTTATAATATSTAATFQQPSVDQDPLQRNNGCPLVQFGFGGKLCMMFPRSTSQYGYGGGGYGEGISTKKSPGAIQIKMMKDVTKTVTAGDGTQIAHLQSFIGPVLLDPDYSSKNKKKQAITYMEQRIAELENTTMMTQGSDVGVRVLLWKLVKLLIEQDGLAESDSTNKAVLDLLRPQKMITTDGDSNFSVPAYGGAEQVQNGQNDEDLSDMVLDKLQEYLAVGDRRGAVNYAIQEDLWSHALIISSCVDRDLWQSVVRGFAQRDLGAPAGGRRTRNYHHVEGNRQGLRVLYALFSGLGASSMSEFFVSTNQAQPTLGDNAAQPTDGPGPKINASLGNDELAKWQETLELVYANRTAKDAEAMTALGDILKNHGWINASHICYLLSPQSSLHSGLDTPYVRYTLVGANNLREILMDVDSYILTELVEFAVSLRTNGGCLPFLQGYKLVHAWWLADQGYVKEAGRYCAAINHCIKNHTKESPYLHQHLFAKVKELTELCNEYHGRKGTGMDVTSWLKPSFKKNTLDSFWGSIEGKFNKFVSGDDTQVEEPSGRKSTEIRASPFEPNIQPPARSASAVDFLRQQPSQQSSYLNFKRFK